MTTYEVLSLFLQGLQAGALVGLSCAVAYYVGRKS